MFDEDVISPADLFGWEAARRNEALADPEVSIHGDLYRVDLCRSLAEDLGDLEQPATPERAFAPTDGSTMRANDDGTITFVASTEDLDRYNSRFQGWYLTPYRRAPIVLYQHQSWGDAGSIGAGKRVYLDEKRRLMADIKFDEGGRNERGQEAARQYRDGFLFAISVRARAKRRTWMGDLPKDHAFYNPKGGILYQDNELIELSSVLIPGNSRAVKVRSLDGLSGQFPDWLKRLSPDGDLDGLARTLGAVLVRALIEQPDSETARSFRALAERAGQPLPVPPSPPAAPAPEPPAPAPEPTPTRQADPWSWLTTPAA